MTSCRETGLTPLIVASAMGRTKVAALLLDKGADPNAVDANGFTPLHHAASTRKPVAIVSALLRTAPSRMSVSIRKSRP